MITTNINKKDLDKAAKQLWSYLEPRIQYLPKNDRDVVELAFTQMVLAHGKDKRKGIIVLSDIDS